MTLPAISIQPGANHSYKIMVVDDERLVADTLALILTQHGFPARAVYSAADAIVEAQSFQPDLLLLDVIMPQLDGIELAARLRELSPNVDILLLSGQAGTSELLASAKSQGRDFEILAKPIAPAELIARIKALAGQS